MAFYETTMIIRPDLSNQQAEQIGTRYADLVKEKSGNVIKTENWGLRTLAYRVKKHRKGHYVMLGFDATGEVVDELERQLRISDDIIRYLSVRVDAMTAEPSVMMQAKNRVSRDGEDGEERAERGERRPRRPRADA